MSQDHGSRSSRTSSPSFTERMRSLTKKRSFASPSGIARRALSVDGSQDGEDPSEVDGEPTQRFSRRRSIFPSSMDAEAVLKQTSESVDSLDKSNSLSKRLSAVHILNSYSGRLPPGSIQRICDSAADLTSSDQAPECREATYGLYDNLAATQELSEEDRQKIYSAIMQNMITKDLFYQFRALQTLTNHGKDLHPFQGEFLPALCDSVKTQYLNVSALRKELKSSGEKRETLIEERGFYRLLKFIISLIERSPKAIQDENMTKLIQGAVFVAEKTISKNDMRKAFGILRACIEHSEIPKEELSSCIGILCAISSAVPELSDVTWDTLILLLSTPLSDYVVSLLVETVALAPHERHSHTVAGALGILCHLVRKDGANNLPVFTLEQFINCLHDVHFASRRIRRDCLKAISLLLNDSNLADRVVASRWDFLVQITLTATGDDTYIHDKTSEPLTIRHRSGANEDGESMAEKEFASQILQKLTSIADAFNGLWKRLSPEQRQLAGMYYFKLRLIIPSDRISALIKNLSEDGYFIPGNPEWKSHQLEIIRIFVWEGMDPYVCASILQILIRATEHAEPNDLEHFHTLFLRLMNDLQNQLTLEVANFLASFAAATWKNYHPESLEKNLERLWPLMLVDGPENESHRLSTLDAASVPFVGLFLHYFNDAPQQAKVVYEFLIEISKSSKVPPRVRLPGLRLFVRMRCNHYGNILMVEEPDTLDLAATLCRTEAAVSSRQNSIHEKVLEEKPTSRHERSSTLSQTLSSVLRNSTGSERPPKTAPKPPMWMHPGGPSFPCPIPKRPSAEIKRPEKSEHEKNTLNAGEWLLIAIEVLQVPSPWEIYSFVLVHLPSQLSNPNLFTNSMPSIQMLRNVIVSQLINGQFAEPPAQTGVKKGDVALCLYHSLIMLLGYTDHFSRSEQDDLVKVFIHGIGTWERTAKPCIQAMAVCCHNIPGSIGKYLLVLLQKVAQVITQSSLSMDILEFLAGLARLPEIYANFREEEFRTLFAICAKYLEHARDQRLKLLGNVQTGDYSSNRVSGTTPKTPATPATPAFEHSTGLDPHKDLPQYVFALAYHVMTVWWLSLKLTERSKHIGWITSKLCWRDHQRNEIMEEQSQVTLDMMHRTAYLDLGETVPRTNFTDADGSVLKKTWLVGMSIVTIETAVTTGLTQITKRQASGTTYATYQHLTAPLPPHHVPLPTDNVMSSEGINIFPNHVFLQLMSTIAPTPAPMEPICLPDDEMSKRALTSFDRNDTVDGYKIGVIYIGNKQTSEAEILANTSGSAAFETFLQGLGTKVKLKGASFNPQGLDREMDSDGEYTYAWRDRVAEIIFHIPTMMPTNLEHDPQSINKKRHIGNDYVNIIFNESGLPFNFDTFPSQFNYVNIVITPEDLPLPIDEPNTNHGDLPEKEPLYTIQTRSKASFPLLSPAASYKLLKLASLPSLARQIALNCVVFSNVWATRDGGEHISAWRNRLREIVKLRERFANTGTGTSSKFPGERAKKTYANGDVFHGRVEMGGLAEEEGIFSGLDFSRWAGNYPALRQGGDK